MFLLHFFARFFEAERIGPQMPQVAMTMRLRGRSSAPLLLLIFAALLLSIPAHAAAAPDLLLKVRRLEKNSYFPPFFEQSIKLALLTLANLLTAASFSLFSLPQKLRAAPSSTATPPSAPTFSSAAGKSPPWGWTSILRLLPLLPFRGSQSFSSAPLPTTKKKTFKTSKPSTARTCSCSQARSTPTPTSTPR